MQADDISFSGYRHEVQVDGLIVQVRQAVEQVTQILDELLGTKGEGQAETH